MHGIAKEQEVAALTSHSHPLPAFIYRPDIDGLRAFAVLVAVLFHAYGPAMPGGYTGADIFFVISGYLITGIILRDAEKGRFHIGDFYVRRCRRIIPALAATLTFCLAAGWQLLWVDDYRYLLRNTFTSALFYQNIFLWQHTDYFAPAAKFHPLLHLWSLGVEEQFYLLWPGLLWLALRWRWNISRLIAALLLLSFTFCLWVVRHDHMAAYYLLPSRFWELAIGGLLAAYRPRLSLSPRVAAVASATGMLMLCASMVVMVAGMPYPSAWALLPTLGTTLVIAAGPQAWLNRCLLSSRPAVFIGLISYPLYLWHWALLALVRINWGEEAPTPWIVGAVACSFLLSVLTYYGLETPARRQTSPQRARAIALGLLAWLAALAIISHANRAGFPAGYAEHPKLQRQYDYNADFRSHHCDLEWGDAITLRPDCIEPDFKKRGNTSLLLWGDSFAAHLYRGLLALKQEAPELRLAQYNKTGCPPLLVEHDIDGCLTFNCPRSS
ncbi:MAG: acyltransferase [Proteobacteria bacterium]|nr:acyltransferase [Pseudomonadota bacterium]